MVSSGIKYAHKFKLLQNLLYLDTCFQYQMGSSNTILIHAATPLTTSESRPKIFQIPVEALAEG